MNTQSAVSEKEAKNVFACLLASGVKPGLIINDSNPIAGYEVTDTQIDSDGSNVHKVWYILNQEGLIDVVITKLEKYVGSPVVKKMKDGTKVTFRREQRTLN